MCVLCLLLHIATINSGLIGECLFAEKERDEQIKNVGNEVAKRSGAAMELITEVKGNKLQS